MKVSIVKYSGDCYMNDQTIHNLSEAIQLDPENATAYLNRGYAYHKKGDDDRAIEDFDNAVRLCPNYETDFIDSKFAQGGIEAVKAAIELLNSKVNSPGESATDFYYAGIALLFQNNKIMARRRFEIALELGYDDREKVKQHLENLNHPE